MNDIPVTAIFALRPGEQIVITEHRFDQSDCYAVMIATVPSFPGDGHVESKSLSVLCAGWYNTETGQSGDEKRWGWVHLEQNTKEFIGRALENVNAIPDKWYYMLTTGGLGNRPRSHFGE